MAHWVGTAIFVASIGFASSAQAQKNQIPNRDKPVDSWLEIEQLKTLFELERVWQDLPEEVRKACSEAKAGYEKAGSDAKTNYEKLQRCMDSLTKH